MHTPNLLPVVNKRRKYCATDLVAMQGTAPVIWDQFWDSMDESGIEAPDDVTEEIRARVAALVD